MGWMVFVSEQAIGRISRLELALHKINIEEYVGQSSFDTVFRRQGFG